MGPSRRSPGTTRPPGVSRGGRPPQQQGGRAGLGRASRNWEDSPGEPPRGGAGGRGRRGRGRGSPHLSGAGDTSTSDRKSKVGARRPRKLLLSSSCFLCHLVSLCSFSQGYFLFSIFHPQPLHLGTLQGSCPASLCLHLALLCACFLSISFWHCLVAALVWWLMCPDCAMFSVSVPVAGCVHGARSSWHAGGLVGRI